MKKNTKQQMVAALLETINIDVFSEDIEDITSFEDLRDYLEEQLLLEVEIVHYYQAMEYLKENDSSLRESLDLAQEMQLKIDDLDSERLASILASSNLREEFNSLEEQITNILK